MHNPCKPLVCGGIDFDYRQHKEVIIDVITLDSTSCAPCQYMMEAVEKAAAKAFVKVYINEHKIKARVGLGMMKKLGVRNLPTICIDGEIVFASIIPDLQTLVKAIEARAIAKNIAGLDYAQAGFNAAPVTPGPEPVVVLIHRGSPSPQMKQFVAWLREGSSFGARLGASIILFPFSICNR